MKTIDKADLYYCAGSSDKVYHIQLKALHDNTHSVECQWGRRGTSLQTQTKISGVDYGTALKTYNQVLKQKTGKGYTHLNAPCEDGNKEGSRITTMSVTPISKKAGIVIPQLPNMIDEVEVEKYLKDDAWGIQEKKDGKHIMFRTDKDSLKCKAYNKKGQEVAFPIEWKSAVKKNYLFDGESINGVLHIFDFLENGSKDLRGLGYLDRYSKLNPLQVNHSYEIGHNLMVVPLVIGEKAKRRFYYKLKATKKEGVVFKKLDAPFTPGRPNSGGDMVKFKFYATASLLVCEGRSEKHSVGLEIIDGTDRVKVGNVTIPPKTDLPPVGSVIEVRYLYAYKGGSLYQPTYLGIRDDIDTEECVISQLKYKSED